MPRKLETQAQVEHSIRVGAARQIAKDVVARWGLPVYSHREVEDKCEPGCWGGWGDASCDPSRTQL